jgi:hypothetical protein
MAHDMRRYAAFAAPDAISLCFPKDYPAHSGPPAFKSFMPCKTFYY